MVNLIAVIIILTILCLAAGYIYKFKKSGRKCIGCPGGAGCGKKGDPFVCSGCCDRDFTR